MYLKTLLITVARVAVLLCLLKTAYTYSDAKNVNLATVFLIVYPLFGVGASVASIIEWFFNDMMRWSNVTIVIWYAWFWPTEAYWLILYPLTHNRFT